MVIIFILKLYYVSHFHASDKMGYWSAIEILKMFSRFFSIQFRTLGQQDLGAFRAGVM